MTFMSPNYRNPRKAASNAFMPKGVYRAVIHDVPWKDGIAFGDDDGLVDIYIPELTGQFVYKNVPCIGFDNSNFYNIGQSVYVAPLDGRSDDFVVLGPVRSKRTQRPIMEQQAVFSWPGSPLSTETSGSFAFTGPDQPTGYAAKVLITGVRATMSDFGSTETTLWLQVNGVDVVGLTPNSWGAPVNNMVQYNFYKDQPMSNGVTQVSRVLDAKTDVISMRVETPGTGAADLVMFVRYRTFYLDDDNGGISWVNA